MDSAVTSLQFDPCLHEFLRASNDQEAQRPLQRLLDAQILPTIDGVLRGKMTAAAGVPNWRGETPDQADAEDLRGEIVVRLIARLNAARSGGNSEPIVSFADFVAVTAFNAVNLHLRRRYPQRTSLTNKLRFLLENREGLALWTDDCSRQMCGFAAWRDRAPDRRPDGRLGRLLDDPQRCARELLPHEHPQHVDPARLLAALFNWVGHPLAFDDLIRIVAELWGVRDAPPQSLPVDHQLSPSQPETRDIAAEALERLDLHRLWAQIRELPPRQCAALLLQAHDPNGNCLIELLAAQGVASWRQIAAEMVMPAEQLAALWQQLPLTDAQIGEILGMRAQQVERLRRAARCLLAKQMPLASETKRS